MWGTKMPKKAGGRYLVTLKALGSVQVRQAKLCEYPKGNFTWLILPECSTHHDDVIAWMKQPEPYKEPPSAARR
jgi:hypothetical protein